VSEIVNELDRRLTARGAATRARIVAAADELMSLNGATATTLDDTTAASGASKSQFYRHFGDKGALVRAVIALQGGRVLEREEQYLRRVDSFSGLDRSCRAILQHHGRGPRGYVLAQAADDRALVRHRHGLRTDVVECLATSAHENPRPR
jgi:AcrR family transcriptional regulator